MCPTRSDVGRNRQRGFALALTVFMMAFIVSVMGMAVDAGVLFSIRSRLSAAADSAALAAAREVSHGSSIADANGQAADSALRFLKAGFPANYLGVDPAHTLVSTSFTRSMEAGRPTGQLLISVHAEVAAPVYFMKLWGVARVPVSVEGKAVRRNLVVVMVLDRSTAAMGAAKMPGYVSPYDSVGAVSFPSAPVIKGPGPDNPNLAAALETAYREIRRVDQKLAANVVLLVSTGATDLTGRNTAIGQAKRLRDDPNYRIRIDSIRLGRPADADLLPIISNLRMIPSQHGGDPVHSTEDKPNRLHDPSQPEGTYVQSVNLQDLGGLLASEASALQTLSRVSVD